MMVNKDVLITKQYELASQIFIPDLKQGYFPSKNDVVYALDIQYAGTDAYIAADLQYWQGNHIGTFAGKAKVDAAYEPGLFCFREGPPLYSFIQNTIKQNLPTPDLIIVDGHGLAHPRRFGVACWLGLAMQKPTIGCAKETLLQYEGELKKERGNTLPIFLHDEEVGSVLRTQNEIKPIFVSVGNMIHLNNANTIILELASAYRIPDMLRRADQAARICSNPAHNSNALLWTNIGEIHEIPSPIH